MTFLVGRIVSLHPSKLLGEFGLQVTGFARVFADVVEPPLTVAHRRGVFGQFQVTEKQGHIAREFVAQRLVRAAHGGRLALEQRQQTFACHGLHALLTVCPAWARQTRQIQQGGRNVGDMG